MQSVVHRQSGRMIRVYFETPSKTNRISVRVGKSSIRVEKKVE